MLIPGSLLRVTDPSSIYYDMVGELVREFNRAYLIEFKLSEWAGGTQRVMFYKHQATTEKKG